MMNAKTSIKLCINSRWMIKDLGCRRYSVVEYSDHLCGRIIFETSLKTKLKIWMDLNGYHIIPDTREIYESEFHNITHIAETKIKLGHVCNRK